MLLIRSYTDSNKSASKKKSVQITRAGSYLKPALVQCAHAAVKSNKSLYYKKKYEALVKRRDKKKAIIAIARMILTAVCQTLFTGKQWKPSDLYKIDMPEALVEKQKAKAIKQAKKPFYTLLMRCPISHGYRHSKFCSKCSETCLQTI